MGIPQHYSREIPSRCLFLIDELWPQVEKLRLPRQQHLGPPTTTFLLAMATPILILPIERIERQRHEKGIEHGYISDRKLSAELTAEVDRAVGRSSFAKSPFFGRGIWSYASIPYRKDLNLSENFPRELSRMLDDEMALKRAEELPTNAWASCVRNALAHGAVFYLGKDSAQIFDNDAHYLVFVSAKENRKERRLESLRMLRIAETDFREFLRRWVGWLESSGLSKALAA